MSGKIYLNINKYFFCCFSSVPLAERFFFFSCFGVCRSKYLCALVRSARTNLKTARRKIEQKKTLVSCDSLCPLFSVCQSISPLFSLCCKAFSSDNMRMRIFMRIQFYIRVQNETVILFHVFSTILCGTSYFKCTNLTQFSFNWTVCFANITCNTENEIITGNYLH